MEPKTLLPLRRSLRKQWRTRSGGSYNLVLYVCCWTLTPIAWHLSGTGALYMNMDLIGCYLLCVEVVVLPSRVAGTCSAE